VIVVRVELWPGGDPRPLRQIAILGIVNVGPDGKGRHSYEARFEGRITRLSHNRADGALALVARAIEALAEGCSCAVRIAPALSDPNQTKCGPEVDSSRQRFGRWLALDPFADGIVRERSAI